MKKRTFLAVFLLVVVLAVIGGLNAWALSAPEDRFAPTATVTVDEGEAFIRHGGGDWQPVAADAALAVGDQVKTNIKSQATVNFFDGASARLDENTEIVVRQLSVDGDDHAATRVDLGVTAGRVWSRVVKLLDRDASYSVQSSSVVATVRGTSFVTDVSSPAGDVVQVVDGVVGVARAPETLAEPAWDDVRAGEEAWMQKKGGRPAAASMQRRAMAEQFRGSAWYRKNVAADEQFTNVVTQKREDTLAAMARVLPGSPRYGLARFGERLRAALTTDPEARRELRMTYQGRRFAEAVLLARVGKGKAMERAWGEYLDGFRAMQREAADAKTAPERSRVMVRRMVGRMMEHRMLIAAVNGGGIPLPENMRARMIGDHADTEAVLGTLRAAFPDALTAPAPLRFAPLEAAIVVPVEEATSTPPTDVPPTNANTNTNTNKPPTNTNQPTNANVPTTATPASLAVTGTRTIMNTPDSQQFRAIVTMTDGTTSDVTTTATWSLTGDPVGTLTRGDLVTSAPGNAVVNGSYAGLAGMYAVRVLPPQLATLQSVSVAPGSATVRSMASQAFTATAHYSDGSSKDVTASAIWSHSNAAAGSMTGNVFQASYQFQIGSTVVTARYTEGSTAAGTANVTVTP